MTPKTTAAGPEVGLEAKVAFLTSPAAYPERPQVVEAKETHMSWVFLTDAHAYKLKKPVRYPFLDYRTIEKRRLNCEAEVRLNRRLAPEVYLGTVALTVDRQGRLHLDAPGRTVDWLVKMQRLPAERTLEAVIAAGDLRDTDVRRIAGRLAAFYRTATPLPVDPGAYRRRFEEEARSTHRELARPAFHLPQDVVGDLAAAQFDFLTARGELLERRARERRIVEAHGDLRPEHIYLIDGPVIVDCLEFNRAFRTLDPADELAYLAMECDRLGEASVDAGLFRAYREETGDDPPRALIDFYKCARAYLRAKIAIWHLDEPQVPERQKWIHRTEQYLELARGYAECLA